MTNAQQELMEKLGIAWGGRRKHYIPKGKATKYVQPGAGYTNILGVIPWPDLHLRFGHPEKAGVSIGTAGIGISSRASKSFKSKPKILKGVTDQLIESSGK